LKDLADIRFPRAKIILLVQDNLNFHSAASLYEAFPRAEARRLVERFSTQCLDPPHSKQTGLEDVAAGEDERNALLCNLTKSCATSDNRHYSAHALATVL
jgi:hypothetical protein